VGRRKKTEKELLENPEATPEARGIRLRRIRNMANLTRQQLCEHSEININSLKGWEIGRYGGLTRSGAEKIINLAINEGVQCTLDWLMYGIGIGPSVNAITIKTYSCIESELQSIKSEDEKIANELALFKKHYRNAIDFLVIDDGMSPTFQQGEYVAGINLTENKINDAIGFNCIVKIGNGNILLRQLRKGSKLGTYTLVCLNINHMPEPIVYNVNIKSAAPVIFHRKKFDIKSFY